MFAICFFCFSLFLSPRSLSLSLPLVSLVPLFSKWVPKEALEPPKKTNKKTDRDYAPRTVCACTPACATDVSPLVSLLASRLCNPFVLSLVPLSHLLVSPMCSHFSPRPRLNSGTTMPQNVGKERERDEREGRNTTYSRKCSQNGPERNQNGPKIAEGRAVAIKVLSGGVYLPMLRRKLFYWFV